MLIWWKFRDGLQMQLMDSELADDAVDTDAL